MIQAFLKVTKLYRDPAQRELTAAEHHIGPTVAEVCTSNHASLNFVKFSGPSESTAAVWKGLSLLLEELNSTPGTLVSPTGKLRTSVSWRGIFLPLTRQHRTPPPVTKSFPTACKSVCSLKSQSMLCSFVVAE